MEIASTAGRRIGLFQIQIRRAIQERLADDRGEGVISMAIAILVIAALGVAMWAAFKGFADDAADEANETIKKIGS